MDLRREKIAWEVEKFVGGGRVTTFDMPVDSGHKLQDRPNISTLNAMLTDPGISFPLHILKLPVSRSKLVYTNPDKDIQTFVNEELKELHRTLLFNAVTALEYGYSAFERRFEMRDGMYHYKEFIHLKPAHIWIRIDPKKKNFNGIEQRYMGKKIDLGVEQSYVFAYQSYFSNLYGKPQIDYAYIPWILDKEFYRYHGVALQEFGLPTLLVRAPEGNRTIDAGEAGTITISNLEFVKLLAESVRSRSVVGMPPGEQWEIGPLFEKRQAVWDFNKDHEWLDRKKALAILVPPEIWREGGGSYAKAKVQSFWFEQTIAVILEELKISVFRHVIKPIIRLNFWGGQEEPHYGELHAESPSMQYREFAENLVKGRDDKSPLDWIALYKLLGLPIVEGEDKNSFSLGDVPTDIKSLEGLCRKTFNRGIEAGKEELAYTGYVPLDDSARETLKSEAYRLQFMLRQTSNPMNVLEVVLGRLRSEGKEAAHSHFYHTIETGNYDKLKGDAHAAA